MAAGFEHPKVKIHIGDGFAFLEDKVDSFDVIITDSSDPVGNFSLDGFHGIFASRKIFSLKTIPFLYIPRNPLGPAASLFQAKFFELMKNALHPGGIICTQCKDQSEKGFEKEKKRQQSVVPSHVSNGFFFFFW